MNAYVLENKSEFDRLEKQSSLPKYDFRKELDGLRIKPNSTVLDAGCGSGIICRYLAALNPGATIMGCDYSELRVRQARQAARGYPNLRFHFQDLTQMSFESDTFDAIVCRYVVEHIPVKTRLKAFKEIYRTLKPGGIFHCVDFDGPVYNIYPQSPFFQKSLEQITKAGLFDLQIGRKIPHLMHQANFSRINWRIETIECTHQTLETEKKLWPAKLETALPLIIQILGSRKKALRFNEEFMETMSSPGSVLFYNKFIVTGVKPDRKRALRLIR